MTIQQPTPAGIVAQNLKRLMEDKKWVAADLARHSGVAARTVAYALEGERNIKINTLERIALAFRLRGWELLISHEDVETLKSGVVGEIALNYLKSDPDGREHIRMVASREATILRR